jgi:hypoxanthine phosphoribosyltransferase
MPNKIFVTWKEVEDYIDFVVKETKDIEFTGVYGIPRGGLVMAVMLSDRLGLPMLMAPCNGALIVDDIADSGRSLIHYTENDTQFNKYAITTFFYHPRSMVTPHWYFKEKEEGSWIVFPWEYDEDRPKNL